MTTPQDALNEPRAPRGGTNAPRVCIRPGCGVEFVPYRPWQTHCSPSCRRAEDREIRQAGRAQLGLVLDNPIARATDPVTSHIAAHAVTESGSRESWCARVYLELLTLREPVTYSELAARMGAEKHGIEKRLNDLYRESPRLAVKCPARKCRVSGRSAQTWQAVSRVVPQESAA